MKKLYLGIILVVFCIIASTIIITQPVKANDPALTLIYRSEHNEYTVNDLLKLNSITGHGSRINSLKKITGPLEYTGVLITILAQQFTDMPSQYNVTTISSDKYIINYTYDNITGKVDVYNTQGKVIGVGGVSMILAYEENGTKNFTGGPLRIAFINQDEPITFSALWAKSVIEIVFNNTPPNKPDTPSGPPSGKVGGEYSYSTRSIDTEGQVPYLWYWGDGTQSDWLGPYDSGVTCEAKHIWIIKNTYNIKVKAKDSCGFESVWSEPLPITIPYIYKSNMLFLQGLLGRFPNAFPILRQLIGCTKNPSLFS
jgi:hypothetical protein